VTATRTAGRRVAAAVRHCREHDGVWATRRKGDAQHCQVHEQHKPRKRDQVSSGDPWRETRTDPWRGDDQGNGQQIKDCDRDFARAGLAVERRQEADPEPGMVELPLLIGRPRGRRERPGSALHAGGVFDDRIVDDGPQVRK